ncbi:TIGR00730 family Rossman fold protein [Gordonia jinhuaensis]|uniref:Cytokinin riboside 5'-monophosphate phosphoribohydrolase n=1 Tax=Gordonia jinhuaensis TaxID=1517702 RepID=A0A916WRS1_9ACTN|nr:TIGR00730 family Rossman fold protein [Gordonia jinhuaensis]GGB23483.1 cytokinin riboside 5'-monophosphate phosphoribohydrolase [Gordonia jinhuaensis]
MTAICVYCASGPVPRHHLELATELGTEIGSRGHTLVSGGGNVSSMGAVARATRAAGGHTIGVIPKALVHREMADVDADELVVTDTMRERKKIMDERADAFIALPGGIGTLEELFETWTGRYLGMHDKPVMLLDPDGFFTPLSDWLRSLVPSGFVRTESLAALETYSSVGSAVDRAEKG